MRTMTDEELDKGWDELIKYMPSRVRVVEITPTETWQVQPQIDETNEGARKLDTDV